MAKYNEDIKEAIRLFLEEDEFHGVAFDEKKGQFRFKMSVGNGIRYADQIIRVGEEDFSSMLICPIEVDENSTKEMEVMAEFICRANYGLKNGCFGMV
ncbi:MAG: hypothetical protein K5744_02870 [Eubacterium sp.]|nr:hypothetical protein [Eubacterium sp.]